MDGLSRARQLLRWTGVVGLLAAPALASAGCGEIPRLVAIDRSIHPQLDTSRFQRVYVAGFVTGGTDEIDANEETVRLLRGQLRLKSDYHSSTPTRCASPTWWPISISCRTR